MVQQDDMPGRRNALVGILVLLLFLGQNATGLTQNLFRSDLVRSWMRIKPAQPGSNALHDDIPDGWVVQTWGGATAIYKIVTDQVFAGQNAISIQRTNTAGGVALAQNIPVPASSQLLLSVYSRGAGGAIQVLAGSDTLGWMNIPAANAWRIYRLTFRVPSTVKTIRLLLRGGDLGTIYFDEAYLGIVSEGKEEPNLLLNSGFEKDGYSGDPLTWWFSEVAAPIRQNHFQRGIPYENIEDMLIGDSSAIQQRARELGDSCSETPAMTGWLLARGEDFEKAGGVFAREQLYKLAIELAPNCPQSYAALADLYMRVQSCWRAAGLYNKAALLSEDTPLSGYFSFQEGMLRQRCTGELELAVVAFQKAEKISGWEGAAWYYGAAPYFLGQVWEALGNQGAAIDAYQRVVACEKCVEYRKAASNRLFLLGATH
jgi:tetratricopeptide (TPR) repeat protein